MLSSEDSDSEQGSSRTIGDDNGGGSRQLSSLGGRLGGGWRQLIGDGVGLLWLRSLVVGDLY